MQRTTRRMCSTLTVTATLSILFAYSHAAAGGMQRHKPVETPLPAQAVWIGRGTAKPVGPAVAICVDQLQPAWTLIYGVPARDSNAPCARRGMHRVPNADINALPARLRSWMRHEVQPAADVATRAVALARQQPGLPVGLTWDGGMAITASDYRAAEQRLRAYEADPQGYAMRYWRDEF